MEDPSGASGLAGVHGTYFCPPRRSRAVSEPGDDYDRMALEMRKAAHAMVLGGRGREERMRVALRLLDSVSDLCMGNGDDQARLFAEAEKIGVHVQRPHFYSPVPTVGELDDGIWHSNDAGIVWDDRAYARLLQELSRFAGDFGGIVESGGWDPRNPAFTHNDASAYYCMIRRLRPGRIIEVGGGTRPGWPRLQPRQSAPGRSPASSRTPASPSTASTCA